MLSKPETITGGGHSDLAAADGTQTPDRHSTVQLRGGNVMDEVLQKTVRRSADKWWTVEPEGADVYIGQPTTDGRTQYKLSFDSSVIEINDNTVQLFDVSVMSVFVFLHAHFYDVRFDRGINSKKSLVQELRCPFCHGSVKMLLSHRFWRNPAISLT